MAKQIPFTRKYPLAKDEAIELMFQYQYSKERDQGKSFRSFVVKKLGKR